MINGQKVVKVFCHEEEAQEGFDRVNDALFESAYKANKYANILMPILINIGNIQYVVIAMVGGALALNGLGGGITLGVIASFLQLSKSLTNPISQISQQLNSVVMALAGAQRIFDLMDEPSEEDHGTVTLVNVSYNKDGASRKPVSAPICGPGRSPRRTGASPIPSWRATCALMMWTSPMRRAKPSSTTSAFSPSPARSWLSWVPPARVRPPLPT